MNESRATRYQRLKRRAQAAGLISAELILALIAFSPCARLLARWADAFARGLTGVPHALVAVLSFVTVLVAIWELAALPAAYLAGRIDGAYGRTAVAAVEDALAAQAQATIVVLPAALVAGVLVALAAAVAGSWWWLATTALLAAGLAAALGAGPIVAHRLAVARPLARTDLAGRLADLARRARVPVAGIDEWMVDDADRTSALVAGIGRSRRVLVASGVARHWADDEIAVVVAHELAHHAHGDLWRTLALDAGVLGVGLLTADGLLARFAPALGVAGPRDLAALPFLALVTSVVWVLATPVRHAASRRQERRADVFALALTGSTGAFASAVRRLGAKHLSEERPSALTRWLFHTHPSVAERLALADAYGQTDAENLKLKT